MGIIDTTKEKLVGAFKSTKGSIGKPPHERTRLEKFFVPPVNLITSGAKGGFRLVMGTPFPTVFRRIAQHINKDDKIFVNDLTAKFSHEGKECHIPSKNKLSNANIIKKDDKLYFQSGGKNYKLNLIKDDHGKEVYDTKNGGKLYEIVDDHKNKILGQDLKKTVKPVVYIKSDNTLDLSNPGQPIYFNSSSKVQGITFMSRNERTAELNWGLSLITFPCAFAASLLKVAGAVIRLPTDAIHYGLSKLSNKLLDDTHSQQKSLKEGSIEYKSPPNETKMNAKIFVGKALEVLANGMKSIGVTADNTLHFTAAVLASSSALSGPQHRQTAKAYLIHSGKELLTGLKHSALDIANPTTKSCDNPSGKFADLIQKDDNKDSEQKSTVTVGAKKEILSNKANLRDRAVSLGKDLQDAGLSYDKANTSIDIQRALHSAAITGQVSSSRGAAPRAA